MILKTPPVLVMVFFVSVCFMTVAGGDTSHSPVMNEQSEKSSPVLSPVLGCPTDHAITVTVVPEEDMSIFVEYKEDSDSSFIRTPAVSAKTGMPQNIILSDLDPDTPYTYRICSQVPGTPGIQNSPEYSFHTQRSSGSPFVFVVQADSHLDERASGELYQRTLMNELNDNPDFCIDLGDTFMTDKLLVKNNETYQNQYLKQRSYLNSIGCSVPLFLVLGNHDGETGYALDNTGENIAVLSSGFRKMYFPCPEPDGFYTGNSDDEVFTGLREDYYSWVWGDALFVVLDPYWYTMIKPGGKTDGWGWTLGKTQYQWLNQTLRKSQAKYKFIFSHQLVGGSDTQGRGGVEYASLYEWGGYNTDGSWGFDKNRPGWGDPIHQLFVQNNVTAFFHGHDHFFAKQDLDGVIYQEVPQPATMSSPKENPGAEYGYINGVMLGSPGYLRVTVSPEQARVEYIKSDITSGKKDTMKNETAAYSYTLHPRES